MQPIIIRLLFRSHFVNDDHILKQFIVFSIKLLQSHLGSPPDQVIYTPRESSLQQIQSQITYCLQIIFSAFRHTSQPRVRNKLMQSFFCRVSLHLCQSSFYVTESLHFSKSKQDNVSLKILHYVRGMQVPVEITAVMQKLNASEYISEDLFRGQRNLVERMLVHFQSHDVVSHWLVDVINLVNANFLGLNDVLPQPFIERNQVLHRCCLSAVLDHDRF